MPASRLLGEQRRSPLGLLGPGPTAQQSAAVAREQNVSARDIVILSARNCRRSRRIIEYLESHDIPFSRIALESAEGRALAEQHQMRASPGIVVDGASVNPFDLLVQGECRVNDDAARRALVERPAAESNR